jgi:hypothetical protein
MNTTEKDWIFLCRFLSHQADEKQSTTIQEWRKASLGNNEIFKDAQLIMQQKCTFPNFNSQTAFKKLDKKIALLS